MNQQLVRLPQQCPDASPFCLRGRGVSAVLRHDPPDSLDAVGSPSTRLTQYRLGCVTHSSSGRVVDPSSVCEALHGLPAHPNRSSR